MTTAEAKEAFFDGCPVLHSSISHRWTKFLYTKISALVYRKDKDGGVTLRLELLDRCGHSVTIVTPGKVERASAEDITEYDRNITLGQQTKLLAKTPTIPPTATPAATPTIPPAATPAATPTATPKTTSPSTLSATPVNPPHTAPPKAAKKNANNVPTAAALGGQAPNAQQVSSQIPKREVDAFFCSAIVSRLNQKAGTAFRASSPKTRRLISARIAEGFTEADFYTVIDNKCLEWNRDPGIGEKDMRVFLRPETLFGSKFEGYLNQKPPKAGYGSIDRPELKRLIHSDFTEDSPGGQI